LKLNELGQARWALVGNKKGRIDASLRKAWKLTVDSQCNFNDLSFDVDNRVICIHYKSWD